MFLFHRMMCNDDVTAGRNLMPFIHVEQKGD